MSYLDKIDVDFEMILIFLMDLSTHLMSPLFVNSFLSNLPRFLAPFHCQRIVIEEAQI